MPHFTSEGSGVSIIAEQGICLTVVLFFPDQESSLLMSTACVTVITEFLKFLPFIKPQRLFDFVAFFLLRPSEI